MTVKEFLPNLTREQRYLIGRAILARFRSLHSGDKPPQINEDEFIVRTYPRIFLIDSVKVLNRFKKKYPDADITTKQRRRIKAHG